MVSDMSKQDDLLKIFKEMQKVEDEYRTKNGLKIEELLYDGYVGDPIDFDNQELCKKILFVGEEAANNSKYKPNKSSEIISKWASDDFWVKKVIKGGACEWDANNYFIKSIMMLYTLIDLYGKKTNKAIIDAVISDKYWNNTNYDRLKNIAYINLKKTGGGGNINNFDTVKKDGRNFSEWVSLHKTNLIDEIELISPQIIVILGVSNTKRVFNKNIKVLCPNRIILYSYHPGYIKRNGNGKNKSVLEKFAKYFLEQNESQLQRINNI